MKALVIYDSQFGNTEKIAQAIRDALSTQVETTLLRVDEATRDPVTGYDLIVVGSPTQRFQPTQPVADLLKGHSLQNVRAAAFDTRFDREDVESGVLRFAMKAAGDAAYAAPRIASQLEKTGAMLVVPAEGFYVEDMEGPLRAGELERAADWAARILATL